MLLVNLLFDLFIQQMPLLNALDEAHVSYHDHHVINGYDRQDLSKAADAYLTDWDNAFEKLLRDINQVRDSHAQKYHAGGSQ